MSEPKPLATANARLIDAQAASSTAQIWGSAPVRSLDAGPNPRQLWHRRGVMRLNAINDQIAGIGAVVVTCTSRDALHGTPQLR